ncbi:MAG: PEGA domain-containing protein [Polyangiaceae bacterium]
MKRFAKKAVVVAVTLQCTVSSLAHAQSPTADPKPATTEAATPKPLAETLSGGAKGEYDSGRTLFLDGDFSNALIKFQAAYEKSQDPRLFWNMASCEKSLRHYAKAAQLLQRYLKDGDKLLTPQDRVDAEEVIKTLTPLTANLKVTVNEPGASVTLDDASLGTSPLPGAVTVDLGSRRLRVTKPGFVEYSNPLTVAGAGDVVVDVRLVKEVHEGQIVVTTGAKDSITFDGRVVGVGRWEGTVASGPHQLKVTSEGMRPYQSEVVVQDNQTRTLSITLDPAEQSNKTVMWLAVAGTAVAVAGASVGGYFLFKGNDSTPTVDGTMSPGTVTLPFRALGR